MAYTPTSRRLSIEIQMKDFNLVFLAETGVAISENFNTTSGFSISSVWESLNVMFQLMQFRTKIVLSGPGKTRNVKKANIENFEQFANIDIHGWIFKQIHQLFYFFRVLGKSGHFSHNSGNYPKQKRFVAVTSRIGSFFGKEALLSKNSDFFRKKLCFLLF